MSKNYRKVFLTIGITGIAFVINYLITLFLTPFITDSVGTEAYGFVSLAKNIAQYATYVTLALNSFATRFISVEYHKDNKDKANIYFSSTFFGDLFLGLLIFLISLIGIWNIQNIFRVPDNIRADVKMLFLFVFLKFLISTILSVNECGAIITNRLYLTGIFRLLSYITEGSILFILFKTLNTKVYFVGIAILGASLVECISNLWIRKRYTPELKVRKKDFSMDAVRELVGNGIWSSVNSVGSFLHSGLDLMICNLMLTPYTMGQLAISENIGLIFKSIYLLVSTPFQPMLLKSYADNNKKKLLRDLKMAMKISSFLSNVCFAGFFALGMVYYKLWIPNQDIELIWRLTMISILTCISSGIIYPTYFIYTLTLKKKIPCFITLIGGALNVISMFFLIRYTSLGVYAVVWTTVVIVSVTNYIVHPLYVAKILHMPKRTLYPELFRCTLACGAMVLLFKLFSNVYMPTSWITLIICALIYATIGVLVHFAIVLNKEEMGIIKSRFAKKGAPS